MEASPSTISTQTNQIDTLWRLASKAQFDPTKKVHSASTACPFTVTETQTSILRFCNLKPNLPLCCVLPTLGTMQFPFHHNYLSCIGKLNMHLTFFSLD